MTTITVTHEDNEVDIFEFDTEMQVISIGRRSTNDVCIPSLSVSGIHAKVTIDGDEALIEDRNSTNGTYVNGRLIARQLLQPNDEVVIGKTRVSVSNSLAGQNTATAAVSRVSVDQTSTDSANTAIHSGINDQNNDVHRAKQAEDIQAKQIPVVERVIQQNPVTAGLLTEGSDVDQHDESYLNEESMRQMENSADSVEELPMSLSEKAKLALGRRGSSSRANPVRPNLKSVAASGITNSATSAANRAFSDNNAGVVKSASVVSSVEQQQASESNSLNEALKSNTSSSTADPIADDVAMEDELALQEAPMESAASVKPILNEPKSKPAVSADEHPLDTASEKISHELEQPVKHTSGAVIEIQNGAKSGQVLPIDKPVTTLGRPGIQIAAIMRKPDGYFLMHIESDDSVDMPTLNRDSIGDEPVMLHSGDRLNVAGIDVEFMLS